MPNVFNVFGRGKSGILNNFLKDALQIKSLFLQLCILKESAVLVLSWNLEPLLPAGEERVANAVSNRADLAMITQKGDLLELNQTREKTY